jgi:hypothetical protein
MIFDVQWLNSDDMLEFHLPNSLLTVALYRHPPNFGVANTGNSLGSCEDFTTELGM